MVNNRIARINDGMKSLRNTRAAYMIEGAKRSRYNARHWFRYLRKYADEEKTVLSEDEIATIIDSGELTMYQIITLKRAMQPGTITNKRAAGLNKRTTTPMVNEILRRHGCA